jgi:hypothetical protein
LREAHSSDASGRTGLVVDTGLATRALGSELGASDVLGANTKRDCTEAVATETRIFARIRDARRVARIESAA